MNKKIILYFVLAFVFVSLFSCVSKEDTIPNEDFTPATINESSIGWYANELMPFPLEKKWQIEKNENKHLYIRGAHPYSGLPKLSSFDTVSASIPKQEVELVTKFADEYCTSFLDNQFASTNYGYNIAYFDNALVSIPFTFYSNFGGSSPEDIIDVLNFDFHNNQRLENTSLFKPYNTFLKTIAPLCKDSLMQQFTKPTNTNPEYTKFLTEIYDVRLLETGTDPSNQDNYQNIAVVPNGILVFFYSGTICKPNAGIWEVFIPIEKIQEFCQFTCHSDAYSEIHYPPNWQLFAENGNFLIHYPTTPTVQKEYPLNLNITKNTPEEGDISILVPVVFTDSKKNNFSSATIEIEWNKSKAFESTDFGTNKITEENIDGIPFSTTSYNDAAAGNEYYTKEYVGECTNIFYKLSITVHSTNVENYDPGTVIEYSKSDVFKSINLVFASFHFR